MTSAVFAEFLNKVLLKDHPQLPKKGLSHRTALNYIHRLGFTTVVIGKNKYRSEVFLPLMAQLDKRSRLYHHGVFLDEITDDNGQYTEIRNSYGVLGGDFHPDLILLEIEKPFTSIRTKQQAKLGSVQKIMFSEKGRAMPARKNE